MGIINDYTSQQQPHEGVLTDEGDNKMEAYFLSLLQAVSDKSLTPKDGMANAIIVISALDKREFGELDARLRPPYAWKDKD